MLCTVNLHITKCKFTGHCKTSKYSVYIKETAKQVSLRAASPAVTDFSQVEKTPEIKEKFYDKMKTLVFEENSCGTNFIWSNI